MMYKLMKEPAVYNDSIGLIPFDANNVDYKNYLQWLAAGNTPLPRDPDAPPSQDDLDVAAAKSYAKLMALKAMSPDQIITWVQANVTTLATVKDVSQTLAIGLSVLARRL